MVVLGVAIFAFGRGFFTGKTEQSLHRFWEMRIFAANTVLFIRQHRAVHPHGGHHRRHHGDQHRGGGGCARLCVRLTHNLVSTLEDIE